MGRVEVCPPDPAWREAFARESPQIAAALGETVVRIYHIGSTAIPGIWAKPIIDLLVEVSDLAQVDGNTAAMAALGYEAMGEYGIPGRRYFRKTTATGIRTHHVHVFLTGSAEVQRHLAFRDYLTAHPDQARQYSDLKRRLAHQFPDDINGYMDGKDPFIQTVQRQALIWQGV